jgi:hypothetical protein
MFFRVWFFASLMLMSSSLYAAIDLSGIWMLSGRAKEGELIMTEEALRIQSEYDLLVDAPSLYCVPASASRVWANPNVRISFDQTEERVLISYEFYDLRRDIPLGDKSVMSDMPSTKNVDGTYFQEMGSSYARYEGDHLIIESRNHSPGYIRTSRGIPQSTNTLAVEELWFEDDTLYLKQTYIDDTLFEMPFVVVYPFKRIEDSEMPLYECTDANYDWFNELNAPKEGEIE